MKALIMSDSHGWTQEVLEIIQRHEHEIDAIFHCGDSELNSDSPELKSMNTVSGNCDFGSDFPNEITEDIKGYRFFVAHGHLLNVKMTEMNLLYKGKEVGAQIVCFGHTHIPVVLKEDGIIILNPGSIRLPRQWNVGTYAIVEAEDEQISVTFYSVDGTEQKELSKKFL
ncbi:metallophosphoesterase family protein [Evansella sp. AB-rgal1]|uniref:metallophosphoesterase family protein n=1 Tax=Evansella sp. AB-rgal1 TaxID=3242696 RepID=UPI00359CDE01